MGKEQIILGINGYSKRVHDASACITVNGNLVAVAEEERFTRKKNTFGQVPHNAIAFCLEDAGVSVDEVDAIAVGWDFNKVFANIGRQCPTERELVDLYLPADKFRYSKRPSIEMVPHHLAHAASAYYLSGYNESLILVMDGQGEKQSTTIYSANGRNISPVQEFPVTDSLGYFYEAVSEYVGLSRLDVGKTMGLAGYGIPRYGFDLITQNQRGYSVDIPTPTQTEMDLQQEVTGFWINHLEESFGSRIDLTTIFDASKIRFQRQTRFTQHHKDMAASAQKTLEDVVRHLIIVYAKKDKLSNLCIAGGVGLNCTMNGVIAREGLVRNLFVPPFPNDSGVSVGAALYVSDQKPTLPLESAFLGPMFSNDTIIDTLKTLGIDYQLVDDIGSKVARLLVEGKTVDWFQGRMEVGPRALGNRSILGNPMERSMHDRLNAIKNREQWRPLAPSFLADRLAEYMQDPSDSPFMLRAFIVKPEMRDKIPAAVHVDGTSRAQTVTKRDSPLYHGVIEEFERATGIPAIMNTSFNLDDEPIVGSPLDAIKTFYSSAADCLAIGNALISKNRS